MYKLTDTFVLILLIFVVFFICHLYIIIIIIRRAPYQCIAPLATNSLHSDLSKASSIASSKVRLWGIVHHRSLFKVAIQEVKGRPTGLLQSL